jgi:carbamate kinase
VQWLLERGTVVICAGGGGIPTMYEPGADRKLIGVEAVIDKDLCSELLARELGADMLVMLTDADAVHAHWGTPQQRPIRRVAPDALEAMSFAAGSMGPKVEAACQFARLTNKPAAIGALTDLALIIDGKAGTTITANADAIVYGL